MLFLSKSQFAVKLLHSFCMYLRTVKSVCVKNVLDILSPCFILVKQLVKETRITEAFDLFPSFSFFI